MNGLPRVLQNEIWEYVHGDRAFWKTKFELVVDELNQVICRVNANDWFRTPVQMLFQTKFMKDVPFVLPKTLKRWRKHDSFFTPDKPWEFSEWTSVWHQWPDHDQF